MCMSIHTFRQAHTHWTLYKPPCRTLHLRTSCQHPISDVLSVVVATHGYNHLFTRDSKIKSLQDITMDFGPRWTKTEKLLFKYTADPGYILNPFFFLLSPMKDDCDTSSSTWKTLCLFPQHVQNSQSSFLCSERGFLGEFLEHRSLKCKKVNCLRNSKHTVPSRSWKDFSSWEYVGVKACLCLVRVAGLCTQNCQSKKQRDELDCLHAPK